MLIYLLKSAACMGIFLLFYKLLLEKEQMHVFKRFYLLASVLAAFIIPSLVFIEYVTPVTTAPSFNQVLEEAPLTLSQAQAKDIDVINWSLIAWTIYSIGFLGFGFRFFRNLLQIIIRVRKNPKLRQKFSIKVLLKEQLPPHTFFYYVFLNKNKFEAGKIPKEVLLHEDVHAKQYHSIDVLFIELLQVVFWFNPLLYFFKRSIKLNHEFLADSGVIQETASASNYQNTLLSYLSKDSITTHSSIRMANAINYSSIKKRFKVMKKQTSKKGMLLRVFLLLPLVALMLYGFSETKYVERTTEIYTNSNTNFHPEYEDLSSNNKPEKRIITLTGLIIDSETLKPIVNVEIYDSNGKSISKTDSKGYYKIDLTIEQEGEIFFNLLLKKEGYKPFLQREHWGDLKGKIEASLFVGLEKKASDYPQFSDLFTNALNISDQVVQDYIKSVKNRIEFDKKIENAKKGNEKIFFKINNSYYLINNSGYIKINSSNDLISIDGNKTVLASEINTILNRSEIISMSPLNPAENSNALYIIYTRKKGGSIPQKTEPFPDFQELTPAPEAPKSKYIREEASNKITQIIKEQDPYDVVGSGLQVMKGAPILFRDTMLIIDNRNSNSKTIKKNSPKVKISTEPIKEGSILNKEMSLDTIKPSIINGALNQQRNNDFHNPLVKNTFPRTSTDTKYISRGNKIKKIEITTSPSMLKQEIPTDISASYNLYTYAQELADRNALFYHDDTPITSITGLSLIESKNYVSVETNPYSSKRPEVRIYTTK